MLVGGAIQHGRNPAEASSGPSHRKVIKARQSSVEAAAALAMWKLWTRESSGKEHEPSGLTPGRLQ